MTVLRHALSGDVFDQTPVSIIFTEAVHLFSSVGDATQVHIWCFFSIVNHGASPLEKRTVRHTKTSKYFPSALGPRSSIDGKSSSSCCEKRVDVATHRTPIQLPSRIQGARHPASTFSTKLL